MFCRLLALSMLLAWCQGRSIDQMLQNALDRAGPLPQNHPAGEGKNAIRAELDMMLSREQWDKIKNNATIRSRKRRKAVNDVTKLWSNGVVPYEIAAEFNDTQRAILTNGMDEWEKYTCVQFVLRTVQTNWIKFIRATGCSSNVGKHGDKEQLIIMDNNCMTRQIVIHEIGHAIGLFHEHSRPDRDQFIDILRRNIITFDQRQGQVQEQFKNMGALIDTYGVTYDYRSIMHYSQFAFSDKVKPTIQTKDPAFQDIIGTAEQLSFKDIKIANLMYKCGDKCANPPTCPSQGYLDSRCGCWCPGPNGSRKQCDMWSGWAEWGLCSASCGGGIQQRARACKQSKRNTNSNCNGIKTDRRLCNDFTCEACVNSFTKPSGTITSPNFPLDYLNMQSCTYIIKVAQAPITLTFTEFELEPCPLEENLIYDLLYIYDGSTEASPLLKSICGYEVPETITSTGRSLMLKLVTDASVPMKGFNATYTSQGGTQNQQDIRQMWPDSEVSATWQNWQEWAACSVTCGSGTRSRTRQCLPTGGTCQGQSEQFETCSQDPCILMKCDFEHLCPQLMVEEDTNEFDWQRQQGDTPSAGTGPDGDHTFRNKSGHFMYTEATDSSAGDLSRMRTDPELSHNYDKVCVNFWYHMKGADMGSLAVFYHETSWNRVHTISGDQGNDWKEAKLTVNTTINTNFKIELEAKCGADYRSDICVDDFLLYSGPCTN